MKNIFLIAFLFISTLTIAQDNVTKELGEFHEVKAYDGLSVKIVQGPKNKAVVSGKNPSDVVFVNKGGKLKIRMNINEVFNGYTTFVVLYTADMVSILDANENAMIAVKETMEQVDLELRAQEGAKIEADVKVERLNTKAITAGVVTVSGTAKNQDVSVNTGGRFEGGDLKSEQTDVDVKAGGVADVNATEYVSAKVKVGGTINVYGSPRVLDKQTFVGGTINEL
ncbi:head GIN domain-containing protein [Joostella sp. CR20]|uniref:head GIN domain-containing protein n=1 Tax=Joostella sp. CR20 TaxID=2804312 RepID=UPI00313C8C6E